MSSCEDRIRAVELYIGLGKRVIPSIPQQGSPTKNALKGRYTEYQQTLDLPVGYAGREPKFSQEKKIGVRRARPYSRLLHRCRREGVNYPGRGDADHLVLRGPSWGQKGRRWPFWPTSALRHAQRAWPELTRRNIHNRSR